MIDTQQTRHNILTKLGNSRGNVAETGNGLATLNNLRGKTNAERLEQFIRVLSAHNSTVHVVDSITDLPQAVSTYLHSLAADPVLYGGNDPFFNTLAWSRFGIVWQETEFSDDGKVAIASAEYGIADTGTLVITASEKNPTRNNFLAEHFIAVLKKETLLPYSEDVWEQLLRSYTTLPRAINFISGPSSSADVGLKLEYGAHGPRTLAVFVYE